MNFVELEVRLDHMRQTMRQAVLDHFGDVQRMIVSSIEEQLKPAAVMSLVAAKVREEIDRAIREQVQVALRLALDYTIRDAVTACAARAAEEALVEIRKQAKR